MTLPSVFNPLDSRQTRSITTPNFIQAIATYDYLQKQYTFRPTKATPLGPWPVSISMIDPTGGTHYETFKVLVIEDPDKCLLNMAGGPSMNVQLTYFLGETPLVVSLKQYFPFDRCTPTLSLLSDPPGATVDGSLINLRASKKQIVIYTTNYIHVVGLHGFKVLASWPPDFLSQSSQAF